MKINFEKVASDFLELSSEQRIKILTKLEEKKHTLSKMAQELDATVPEVHRNFTRLANSGLIHKDPEGIFELTEYGKIVLSMIPGFVFISDNRKFFEKHNFGNMPLKFIQRISSLQNSIHIKGFVKVLEQWKNIHSNSKTFVKNILYEVPYSQDIMETIEKKLVNNIHIQSIFSEDAVIPEERKKIFQKFDFKRFVENGTLERKMTKSVQLMILINEDEACVIFPNNNGEPDMSEMFYSKDPSFREWCDDYFSYCWKTAFSFQENKLK